MRKMRRPFQRFVRFTFTLIFALLFFAPFALVILNSLKPQDQIMTNLLGFPSSFRWENYVKAWEALNMSRVLFNTVVVTLCSVLLILMLSSMVAYWITRHPTKYGNFFRNLLLASLLIPFASVMLPLVKTVSAIGLIGTLWGGVFTYVGIGLAFATFILSGAVRAIPIEIETAAMLDGCNVYQLFFRIVLPMLGPTFLSVFILDLFWIWNDYIVALIMLNGIDLHTIQLAINKFFGLHSNQWDLALPAIVMGIAPIFIVNILLQKRIVEGVASGALKG